MVDRRKVAVVGDRGDGRLEINEAVCPCETLFACDLTAGNGEEVVAAVACAEADAAAGKALQQIQDKSYTLPFEMNGQKIIRIGYIYVPKE